MNVKEIVEKLEELDQILSCQAWEIETARANDCGDMIPSEYMMEYENNCYEYSMIRDLLYKAWKEDSTSVPREYADSFEEGDRIEAELEEMGFFLEEVC